MPCRNPDSYRDSHKEFQQITEAYQVLRDKGKRAQYDMMLRAGTGSSAQDFEAYERSPFGTGADEDFERQFDEWWKRMSSE
mgnify:CR=1 FL=1